MSGMPRHWLDLDGVHDVCDGVLRVRPATPTAGGRHKRLCRAARFFFARRIGSSKNKSSNKHFRKWT